MSEDDGHKQHHPLSVLSSPFNERVGQSGQEIRVSSIRSASMREDGGGRSIRSMSMRELAGSAEGYAGDTSGRTLLSRSFGYSMEQHCIAIGKMWKFSRTFSCSFG